MFQSCKIKLYLDKEWIFVRLGGPLPMPVDHIQNARDAMEWFTNFNIAGQFMVRQNSVTGKSDPGKFVISQTRWPESFWTYSHLERALHFVSHGPWGGGGLRYGEMESRFQVLLTLHEAKMTGRGIEPISVNWTGRATVKSGGNMMMLRQGSIVNWEWRSWDWHADEG